MRINAFSKILSNERRAWVEVKLSVAVDPIDVENIKKILEPYAENLGWIICEGTHRKQENILTDLKGKTTKKTVEKVDIFICPKDIYMTPLEYEEIYQKLQEYNYYIERILGMGIHEKNDTLYSPSYKHKAEDYIIFHVDGFVMVNYKLIDRRRLEKANKKLSVRLFGSTVQDYLKNLKKTSIEFIEEDYKESKKRGKVKILKSVKKKLKEADEKEYKKALKELKKDNVLLEKFFDVKL